MSRILTAVAVTLLMAVPAVAHQQSDRVHIGRTLIVAAGEKSGDLVCVFCSITIRGETEGDVVAIAGSITLEQGARTSGDVVAIAGSVRAGSGSSIGGDLVTIGGGLHRDPNSAIGGSVTSVGGPGLAIMIVFFPLAFVAGIIALIVWLVQRNRQPETADYPAGTTNIR